jgi:hypothetical protein
MSRGLLFWILMILWFVFGLWASWPLGWGFGSTVLLFVLLALLGWQVFGPAIKG